MRDGYESVELAIPGLQVVDVTVDDGYRPAVIRARAQLPLRLIFHRLDASDCAERVVFSTPRIERHLTLAAATIIDLPAQPAGNVRFTCGMGRYVGRIELANAPLSLAARVRGQVWQMRSPLGTAIVLWLWSLPLIALLAALMLDTNAAVTLASGALVGWVLACLWAFWRTEMHGRGNQAAHTRRHHWRVKRP